MTGDKAGPPKPKRPEPGKDSAGHEFAGDVGIRESLAPPRPAPGPAGPAIGPGRAVPRVARPSGPAPTPPAPPAVVRPPDASVAGSKYFAPSGPPPPPRQLSSIRREGDSDSEALDSTLEEDLGEMRRRRERGRAAHATEQPVPEEAPSESGGSGGRKELDAEARPRELDFSAPDMPRKRRSPGP